MNNDTNGLDRRAALGLGLLAGTAAVATAPVALAAQPGTTAAATPGGTVRTPDTSVETAQGKVAGYLRSGVWTFKGIPYADTTAGANRWMPPQPAKPWTGVRSSRNYGPTCPQPAREGWHDDATAFLFQWDDGFPGEDCLRANIWTPAINDGRKRPVLFWIHGGGFSAGSGQELPSYYGENIARKGDLVFVSVNHRLGPLGFLNLAGVAPGYDDSANVSMLDLVAALKWVRENIAAFGGDANNVTILGQSGGGAKVGTLMAMPSAHGLFHKAWVMSGSSSSANSVDGSQKLTQAVLSELGGYDAAKLRDMSVDAFIAASYAAQRKISPPMAIGAPGPRGPSFGPVAGIAGIPEVPFGSAAPRISAEIPMVVGSTRDEFGGRGDPISEAELRSGLEKTWGDKAGVILAAARKDFPTESPVNLRKIISSIMMRQAALGQLDKQHAAGQRRLFNYYFVWQTKILDGTPGAFHCQDINFWFDNTARAENCTGNTADAQHVADAMSSAVIAYAHTGAPSTPSLRWPAYTPDGHQTLVFDSVSRAVADPAGDIVRTAVRT